MLDNHDWREILDAAVNVFPPVEREDRQSQQQCLREMADDLMRTLPGVKVHVDLGSKRPDHVEISYEGTSFRLQFCDRVLVAMPVAYRFLSRQALSITGLDQVREVYDLMTKAVAEARTEAERKERIRRLKMRSFESRVREQMQRRSPGTRLVLKFTSYLHDPDMRAELITENGWKIGADFICDLDQGPPDLSKLLALARALRKVPAEDDTRYKIEQTK